MIRSTQNESIRTTERTVLGQTSEITYGSVDGIAPAGTTELTEVEFLAQAPGNTFSIVPSNEHNGS